MKSFKVGDVVYSSETDELLIVCARFGLKGWIQVYNMENSYEKVAGGHINGIYLAVHNIDGNFILISKGDFK